MLLALALWLYSFYRLYLVWQNTLNFQESSIQGPQGWDLLVNWILERIRKDFGSLLRVCVNDTGSMRSQTHVEWFHTDPLAKAMQRRVLFFLTQA